MTTFFLRGWGVQWNENGGRCGICGDPWQDFPREHEAPLGKFATGTVKILNEITQNEIFRNHSEEVH